MTHATAGGGDWPAASPPPAGSSPLPHDLVVSVQRGLHMNPALNDPGTPSSADVICSPLPVTGSPLVGILGLALALALVGAFLLAVSRRGRRAQSAALFAGVLLLLAPLLVTQSQPASATVRCPPGEQPPPALPVPVSTHPVAPTSQTGAVRVAGVPTSVNTSLAPEVTATPLFGEVRNTSRETIYVTDVVVAVTGVTKARTATTGSCGPSDYLLKGRQVPLDAVLEPGQKVEFTGARIGFAKKSVNQDACKGAIISLGYTSS